MRYIVEILTIWGDWYENNRYLSMREAMSDLGFHQYVTGRAEAGGRIRDCDTGQIINL